MLLSKTRTIKYKHTNTNLSTTHAAEVVDEDVNKDADEEVNQNVGKKKDNDRSTAAE